MNRTVLFAATLLVLTNAGIHVWAQMPGPASKVVAAMTEGSPDARWKLVLD